MFSWTPEINSDQHHQIWTTMSSPCRRWSSHSWSSTFRRPPSTRTGRASTASWTSLCELARS